jgi:hypothetical protein
MPSAGGPGTFTAGTLTSFNIRLRGGGCTGLSGDDCYEREATGGMYFYLYVKGIDGSSENDYDLRVGPPSQQNSCANVSSDHCQINWHNYHHFNNGWPDWTDGGAGGAGGPGGARIFAKRALPLNLLTGAQFPLMMTQVSKHAGGQTLGVRHFDQDCNRGCGSPMQYQMQICGCTDLNDPDCWSDIAVGYVGPNNGWVQSPNPDPELVPIPVEGTAEYTLFFGNAGQCDTSWMRIEANPSYSNDTTVWEIPFMRPRLIR